MRKLLFVVVGAFLFASPASAHIGFKRGPDSARQYAVAMNRWAEVDQVVCRYRTPHVVCTGVIRQPRTDAWLQFRLTVHKTAARKGYSMTCLTVLGVCRRDEITFGI